MKIVAAGTNPVQLTRGIEKTVTALVKELQALSVDVADSDLANVATVSAGGNPVVMKPSSCSGHDAVGVSKAQFLKWAMGNGLGT